MGSRRVGECELAGDTCSPLLWGCRSMHSWVGLYLDFFSHFLFQPPEKDQCLGALIHRLMRFLWGSGMLDAILELAVCKCKDDMMQEENDFCAF